MRHTGCNKTAKKNNPLALPTEPYLSATHKYLPQSSDPYATRLLEQRKKLIGSKSDFVAPTSQAENTQKILVLMAQDIHQTAKPLHPFAPPLSGGCQKKR